MWGYCAVLSAGWGAGGVVQGAKCTQVRGICGKFLREVIIKGNLHMEVRL